jgi:hypothetical protein
MIAGSVLLLNSYTKGNVFVCISARSVARQISGSSARAVLLPIIVYRARRGYGKKMRVPGPAPPNRSQRIAKAADRLGYGKRGRPRYLFSYSS